MHEPTSVPSAYPSSHRIPTEEETRRRMAFQALHPEVGFRFLDGRWVAYWADADCTPRHRTAATLTGLLDELGPLFPLAAGNPFPVTPG